MTRLRSSFQAPHPALRRLTAFALPYVGNRMRSSVAATLGEHGLPWVEFTTLLVACEVPGLSQEGLADRTTVNRTRISEAVGWLEAKELISRTAAGDRRRRLVGPTPKGRAVLGMVSPSVAWAKRSALLPLDSRERRRLAALAAKAVPSDPVGIWSCRSP